MTSTKRCTVCKTEKPLSAFSLARTKNYPNHVRSRCKPCHSKYNHEYKKRQPQQVRSREYRKATLAKRGLPLSWYYEQLAEQREACAICESRTPAFGKGKFDIDHCHETGWARGLLCGPCNRAVGLIKDSQKIALRMARYLHRWDAMKLGLLGTKTKGPRP